MAWNEVLKVQACCFSTEVFRGVIVEVKIWIAQMLNECSKILFLLLLPLLLSQILFSLSAYQVSLIAELTNTYT